MVKILISLISFFVFIPNIFTFNSWDFFDTLVARKLLHPHAHYDFIENNFPFPDFKKIRIKSEQISEGDLDSIYLALQNLTGISDCKRDLLKKYEIEVESDNLFPIMDNFQKLNDGDLIVSDTYYSKKQIEFFLKKLGLEKNISLYVSRDGKHNGTMWQHLINIYGTNFIHTGDNYHSDILMPKKYGLNSIYYNESNLTKDEKVLKNKFQDLNLALLIRSMRLSNPWPKFSAERKVFEEQVQKNIPILVLFSHVLKNIYYQKNIDKILFSTRDCCLLRKIFNDLYPEIPSYEFHCSRRLYKNPTESYLDYVNKLCTGKSLIVDLQGSGDSVVNFFENLICKPNIIYLVQKRKNKNLLKWIKNEQFISPDHDIEKYNYDLIGSLVDFIDEIPIRKDLEYNPHLVKIMHEAVNYFRKNFLSYFDIIYKEEKLLYFLQKSKLSKFIKNNINHEHVH